MSRANINFSLHSFLDKEVLQNVVKVSLATRRASAFGGRGGFRGGRGGSRGRGKSLTD